MRKPCEPCGSACLQQGRRILDFRFHPGSQAPLFAEKDCSKPYAAMRPFPDIAGLARLRDWIGKRKSALTPEGQKFGLVSPKGILITGVQGCGKSLAAKAIAGEWGFELARLDAGALYDKYRRRK